MPGGEKEDGGIPLVSFSVPIFYLFLFRVAMLNC